MGSECGSRSGPPSPTLGPIPVAARDGMRGGGVPQEGVPLMKKRPRTSKKKRPRVGDVCFEVEFCVWVYVDPDDSLCIPDLPESRFEHFATRAEALAFCKENFERSVDEN